MHQISRIQLTVEQASVEPASDLTVLFFPEKNYYYYPDNLLILKRIMCFIRII